ncbi:hypothetical protein GUJ93_ZPchr0009g256 [Zizania palustris]|uniref:Uncharacterized protein n=1 Tax=Zizania palustris TaxID=103762 RepID=A0A8J5V2I4_ZIZPA|nr:hypothetical protein GUJ93_ZPchr0009g256 [Zizania palustris]
MAVCCDVVRVASTAIVEVWGNVCTSGKVIWPRDATQLRGAACGWEAPDHGHGKLLWSSHAAVVAEPRKRLCGMGDVGAAKCALWGLCVGKLWHRLRGMHEANFMGHSGDERVHY